MLWMPPACATRLAYGEERAELLDTLRGLTAANTHALPPITAEQLQETVRHLTRRKARGVDHWSVEQLQTMPPEA